MSPLPLPCLADFIVSDFVSDLVASDAFMSVLPASDFAALLSLFVLSVLDEPDAAGLLLGMLLPPLALSFD